MRLRTTCGAALAVTVSGLLAPAAAHGATLTLTAGDVPGLRAAGHGRAVAKAAFGGVLPRGPAAQGTALRGAGRTVRSAAVVYPSARAATAALARAHRGARRLAGVGEAAWRRTHTTKRATDAFVVLRAGPALGAVRVTLPGRQSVYAAGLAAAAARSLAARLAAGAGSTAYERTLDGIGADGSITPKLALQAFAIAYGPVPGVARPKAGLGVPESATLAMQLAARQWDALSAAQRQAVDRALGAAHDPTMPPVARTVVPRTPGARPPSTTRVQTLTPNASFQAIAEQFAAFYAARLPGVARPVLKVYKASEEITTGGGGTAWADALPLDAAGNWGTGTPASCRIRVPPAGQSQVGKPFFRLVMAHEVFHCFQFQAMTAWRQRTAWIIEGMADWAATSAFKTTAKVGAGPYRAYLATAGAPLFGRSYDATGFWHWVDESHGVGSLWPNIPLVLGSEDDGAAFVLAGGGDLSFTETWASAAWRWTGAGPDWRQTRPYPISINQLNAQAFPTGPLTPLQTDPHQMRDYVVVGNPAEPLVEVTQQAGKLRGGRASHDYGLVEGTRWFCLGTCRCPPGKKLSSIPANEKVTGALVLGLTGGALPGAGQVRTHKLDEFCRKDQPKPSGPAETNGDPHLTTLDGLHFDFQAAGEFVLVKGTGLEVQARQEPFGKSTTVTVNTQLAMRVGGHRVTVSTAPAADDAPVVRIDGAVTPLAPGAPLAVGDGTVSLQDVQRYVTVTWSDGSTVVVRPVGRWGVAAVVQLAGDRARHVRGLLGDFDDDPADDLTTRGGTRIPYTARSAGDDWSGAHRYTVREEGRDAFFDDLYDTVGDAWRVSKAESLFDYGPGQSTATFTKRKLPAKPLTAEQLSAAKRAKAERICRAHGVTEAGPLADCILDVAATGDAAFADEARAAQEAASVAWTQLSAGRQIVGQIRIARTAGGTLHVGYVRDAGGGTRVASSVAVDQAGREGAEETVAPIDGDVGLYATPAGGVGAVVNELPETGSSGIYRYERAADTGAWAPLGLLTGYGTSYAGRPSALSLPDGTLLTLSPMASVARLFVGQPAGDGVPVPATDGCYATNAALARDAASGAVLVGWIQWGCPQQGVFVATFDPATGAFAAPVQAPDSTWVDGGTPSRPDVNLDDDLALTAQPGQDGLVLAYPTGTQGDVAVWRVGAATATRVPRRAAPARDVRIAADPAGGRLWVTWREGPRIWVQRTTAAGGPDGAPRPVAPPSDDTGDLLRLDDLQASATAAGLDLVFARRGGTTPGGLYRARLAP